MLPSFVTGGRFEICIFGFIIIPLFALTNSNIQFETGTVDGLYSNTFIISKNLKSCQALEKGGNAGIECLNLELEVLI